MHQFPTRAYRFIFYNRTRIIIRKFAPVQSGESTRAASTCAACVAVRVTTHDDEDGETYDARKTSRRLDANNIFIPELTMRTRARHRSSP
jgi:hypothetical protein